MIVALETSKAMSLSLCLNSKVWGKCLDPTRVAVAEDGVCAEGKLINNIKKCVEIKLEASNAAGKGSNA
jgi:hypothetical protein